MNNLTTGEIIAKLRKERGLSQEELAEALYVTRQAISKWESGAGSPDINNLKNIAAYFNVSVDYLINGREEKNEEQEIVPSPSNRGQAAKIKKEASENMKKFNFLFSILLAVSTLCWIISLFVPMVEALGIGASVMDYFDTNALAILLYLLAYIILFSSFIFVSVKKNLKRLFFYNLVPILGFFIALILAISSMMMFAMDVELIIPNGPAFYLAMASIILAGGGAITQGLFNWGIKSGKFKPSFFVAKK